MSTPDAALETALDLLSGPAMQVDVISPSGEAKSWTIPKALLQHHTTYFRGAEKFKEGAEGKVTLTDFEPKTFGIFVEFIYRRHYDDLDDYTDITRVHEGAKAWVLGDYLGAVRFKNASMRKLHDTFFPSDRATPKAVINWQTMDYCCIESTFSSKLTVLYCHASALYWSTTAVHYESDDCQDWYKFNVKHPSFGGLLLYLLRHRHDLRREIARADKFFDKEPGSELPEGV